MHRGASLIIFSDLDGTLLDHETYTFAPARPALTRLRRLAVPLVLASSKTALEIRRVQKAMGLTGVPAIVENGAGLLAEAEQQPAPYRDLRRLLEQLPPDLRAGFTGFGDMTDSEVADLTGLPLEEAALARARAFSEPGVWKSDAARKQAFLDELAGHGISAREGGRFLTLSFGATKRDRIAEITAQFRAERTAALGDAPNDVEMLQNVDYGFIVANPHRSPLPQLAGEAEGQILRTSLPGPAGWNAAVNGLLDRLGLD